MPVGSLWLKVTVAVVIDVSTVIFRAKINSKKWTGLTLGILRAHEKQTKTREKLLTYWWHSKRLMPTFADDILKPTPDTQKVGKSIRLARFEILERAGIRGFAKICPAGWTDPGVLDENFKIFGCRTLRRGCFHLHRRRWRGLDVQINWCYRTHMR